MPAIDLALPMPMPAYLIRCSRKDCDKPAVYKIAARWSDGITEELKTYALSCEECLAASFHRSRDKQAVCRLTSGESLDLPGIYRVERGRRDHQLQRLTDLENRLLAEGLPTANP